MKYKDFVKLCLCNARNSIEVENIKRILPIKWEDIEIAYIDETRISISSQKYHDEIISENGYFRCDEILKSIAKIYDIKYVDTTLRNLLILQKELYKVVGINEGE